MDAFTLPFFTAAEALTSAPKDWLWVDVRKAPAARATGQTLQGALWIDPFTLGFEHPILVAAPGLIIFCVHGHAVSQFATALSLVADTPARYVQGGYDALCTAGAQLTTWTEAQA